MELGHFHLQLIMSLTLILTAAVVALICDVLKRSNEQLREMNIELQIRQEEEQKRWSPGVRQTEPKVEKIAPPVSLAAAPKERSALGKEKKRTVNSEALAAIERGAALAGSGGRPRSAAVPESQVVSQPAAQSVIKKDWGLLLNRNAQGAKLDSAPPTPVATPSPAAFETGFHKGYEDGHVLSKLIQSREPISGLVVSIGVNAPSTTAGDLPEAVVKLVKSLIGPHDFATQSAADEFLLIYPQEHGASAQRRLSQIARQLWDFQLRSLGSFQILFSWGGVEVRSESIEEAIASASERMQETKRGRKVLTMETPTLPAAGQLRQAV